MRLDYPLGPTALVVDAGGYEGQWASDIFGRFACRVHVFEPVASFADRIGARFAHNPAIVVHREGLAGRTRTETIHLRANGSSIFGRAEGPGETIALRDVAEWWSAHHIEQIDLLKLNIEGGEYEVLERLLETGLVARVVAVQVQFHQTVPDAAARYEKIAAALAATHRLTWRYPWVWENWQRR